MENTLDFSQLDKLTHAYVQLSGLKKVVGKFGLEASTATVFDEDLEFMGVKATDSKVEVLSKITTAQEGLWDHIKAFIMKVYMYIKHSVKALFGMFDDGKWNEDMIKITLIEKKDKPFNYAKADVLKEFQSIHFVTAAAAPLKSNDGYTLNKNIDNILKEHGFKSVDNAIAMDDTPIKEGTYGSNGWDTVAITSMQKELEATKKTLISSSEILPHMSDFYSNQSGSASSDDVNLISEVLHAFQDINMACTKALRLRVNIVNQVIN